MGGVSVSRNIGLIIKAFRNVDQNLKKEYLGEVTDDLYDEIKKRIVPHTKTGLMERNLAKRVTRSKVTFFFRNQGMKTESGIGYAVFVHFGTKPHKIKPKDKKSLRWATNGQFHFSKEVNHPGYKGDPFMYDALESTIGRIDQIFNKVTEDLAND